MRQVAKHMERLFAVALLVGAAAVASADAQQRKLDFSPNAFKDLPGVSPTPLSPKPEYQCQLVTRQTDRLGEIDFLGRSGMPQLLYRCEKDGYAFESTRPPQSWEWAPGINPHHLPSQ